MKKKERIIGLPRNVFFLGLTSFFNDFSSEMILSILPAFFISVLKTGAASLGLVEGIADFSANVIKIYSGRFSDKIQKKKIFAVSGYVLSVFTRPFYYFVGSVAGVVGLRVADRIGKGLRDSPRDALISLSTPEGEMGRAFGYHRAMDTAGAIVGPLVAFLILRQFPQGFNIIFVTAFVVGLAALASLVLVKEIKVMAQNRKEVASSPYAFPLQFKLYLASMFLLSLGTLPVAILLFRAKDIGFIIASIPLFYMIYSISYALFSAPAGRVADKIGEKKVIFFGYFALLAGYLVLGTAQSLLMLIAGFLLVGVFSALTDGTQRAHVANIIPGGYHGSAFGYLNAVIGFGYLFAGIVGGYLWQNFGAVSALGASVIAVILGLILFSIRAK
ncbi:MAG: MFS transporter [Candidatus Taylorbacteria bacterium]